MQGLSPDGRHDELVLIEENNSIKRAYHLPLGRTVREIRLTVLANWGDTDLTRVLSFDFN